MTVTESAESYFTGHLAGAEAAIKLVRRMAASDQGTALGGFASSLARDIEEDKSLLEEIMAQLDISPSGIQEALTRVAEQAGHMLLERQAGDDEAMVKLIRLETLSLGIEGKRCLWKALKEGAALDPRLAKTDFDDLIRRAESQRDAVEQHRLTAARAMFATS
ncbi:MAG: hypothetical protein ACRD0K_07400 [Egibacteraceae bacterium]